MAIKYLHYKIVLALLLSSVHSFHFPSSSVRTGICHRCSSRSATAPTNPVDICVIGGGVSGLTAAITAAELSSEKDNNILILEASAKVGGRVSSERTDGFIFDKGFAVFIDSYPQPKTLLDFEALDLQPFDAGALIKIPGKSTLARIADPRRQPRYLLQTLSTPVGTFMDKFRLIPLFLYLVSKDVPDFFKDEEHDTYYILKYRYGFSDKMISEFFAPFLEGIYLCPLREQSSRMFHFVMKMFLNGSATLPRQGMQAVSDQLLSKAQSLDVDIEVESPVSNLKLDKLTGITAISIEGRTESIQARKIVVATEGIMALKLLATLDGFEFLQEFDRQPQRSIGCVYYSFGTEAPIRDPILILNGNRDSIVNNVCFPSEVSESYGSKNRGLCCVTILESRMKKYEGRRDLLDTLVRAELTEWFPDCATEIKDEWNLERLFNIQNAQPSNYGGAFPANINGGRDCKTFMGVRLPQGIYVCGDHVVSTTKRKIWYQLVFFLLQHSSLK